MRHLHLLALLLLFTACAGRTETTRALHAGLNSMTDVVDPAYELAVTTCDALERSAVARNTTPDTARAAVLRVRARCDRTFAAFEATRAEQSAARAVVESFRGGTVTLVEAVTAVERLRAAWKRTWALVEALKGGQ